MALPNSNISVSMVKSAIGSGSNDVGTLCTHPNVNKWSKWKPVRFNKVTGLTLSDLGSAKGGMNLIEISEIDSLIDFYKNNISYDWSYLKPRGGNYNEFYRLGDFRSYHHEAIRFFDTEKLPSAMTPRTQIETFILPADVSIPILNMDYESMGLDNAYFGVVIVWINPFNEWEYVTMGWAENVLGLGNFASRVYIPTTGMQVGRIYRAYGFIGYQGIFPNPDTFIPIPDAFMGEFTYEAGIRVLLNPYRDSSGDIEAAPQFINDGANTVTLMNCFIYVRYADNNPLDPLELGEDEWDMGTIVLPPNGYIGDHHIFLDALPDFANRGGYLYFSNTTNFAYNKQEYID